MVATVAVLFSLGMTSCGGEGESDNTVEPTVSPPVMTATAEALPPVEEPPPSASQLIGLWQEIDGPAFLRFKRDGTFTLDTDLEVPYFATGTYELDGDMIAFSSNGPICGGSWELLVGFVEAEGESEDRLHIVFPDAGACTVKTGTEATFARM